MSFSCPISLQRSCCTPTIMYMLLCFYFINIKWSGALLGTGTTSVNKAHKNPALTELMRTHELERGSKSPQLERGSKRWDTVCHGHSAFLGTRKSPGLGHTVSTFGWKKGRTGSGWEEWGRTVPVQDLILSLFYFYFLAVPCDTWDLRSLTRYQTWAPCIGSWGS